LWNVKSVVRDGYEGADPGFPRGDPGTMASTESEPIMGPGGKVPSPAGSMGRAMEAFSPFS